MVSSPEKRMIMDNKTRFSLYLDDLLGSYDDLSSVAIQDDAFDELQAVVSKTMKLKTKKDNVPSERVSFHFVITQISQSSNFVI